MNPKLQRVAVLKHESTLIVELPLLEHEFPRLIKHGPNVYVQGMVTLHHAAPESSVETCDYQRADLFSGDHGQMLAEVYDDQDLQIARLQAIDLLEHKARALYSAYNDCPPNPWKSWNGKPVPKWEDLQGDAGDQVKRKWRAVALVTL